MHKKNYSQMNLEEITKEMNSLDLRYQKNWYRFYFLLKEIEDRELFKEMSTSIYNERIDGQMYLMLQPTMSAWITNYCSDPKNKLTRNRIYTIKRAGKIFEDYLKRKEINFDDLNGYVAPQTIVNIDKIVSAKLNKKQISEEEVTKEIDCYMEKALTGNLTRDESARIYKKIAYGDSEIVQNINILERGSVKQMKKEISQDWSWLGEKSSSRELYKGISNINFPIDNGKKNNDIVIFENLKTKTPDHVACHLIRVVSKLENSQKIFDQLWYLRKYFDYIWIMAPEEEFAKYELGDPSPIGFIGFKDSPAHSEKIVVLRKATKNKSKKTRRIFEQYILNN